MKTTGTLSLVLASLLASLQFTAVEASCPRFSTGATSCSAGPFTSSSLSASCEDNAVTVVGSVTASEFDDDAKVTAVPCVMGIYCYKKWKKSLGKVCDILTNVDGNDCGSAGDYAVDETVQVPDSALTSSMLMGAIVVQIFIDDEEACTQKGQAKSSSSSGYMMMGVSALALGGLGFYLVRRQRKRPLLVLEGAQDSFVEMKDQPSPANGRPGAWV